MHVDLSKPGWIAVVDSKNSTLFRVDSNNVILADLEYLKKVKKVNYVSFEGKDVNNRIRLSSTLFYEKGFMHQFYLANDLELDYPGEYWVTPSHSLDSIEFVGSNHSLFIRKFYK